jgi:hypothetical protein
VWHSTRDRLPIISAHFANKAAKALVLRLREFGLWVGCERREKPWGWEQGRTGCQKPLSSQKITGH